MKLIGAFLLCCFLASPVMNAHAAQASITCDQFKTQSAAQFVLNDNNEDSLDPDGDGIACEELPGTSSRSSSGSQDDEQQSSQGGELTSQDQTYLRNLNEQSMQFAEASTELGDLFGQFSDDTSLLFDDTWRTNVVINLAIWKQVGVEAKTLNPSNRQEHLHDLWLEVNRLITLAADEYIAGFDALDAASIDQATSRINYATLLIYDLTTAIEEFKNNPDRPVEPEQVIAPVADCDAFSDFDQAQLYYAANPEEQQTIDPDFDGDACEVFFGGGGSSAPASADEPQAEQPVQVEQPAQVEQPVKEQPVEEPVAGGCDPNYSPCIPAHPPDLDCPQIGISVTVIGGDPHGLDRDNDGTGCDAN